MDSYQQRLQQIREENESKWKILTGQYAQIEGEHKDTAAADGQQQQDHNIADSKRDPKETLRTALQVELDLLKSHTWTAPASVSPLQDFHREVVSSYDELRETHSVLLQQLALESERLERLQDTHEQHQRLNERLKSMSSADMRSNQQKDAVQQSKDDEKDENEWIRGELKYIASQLTKGTKAAEGINRHDALISSSKKGKEKKQQPASRKRRWQEKEEADLSTMDQLVLELLKLQQTSPIDPYLRTDALSVEPTDIDFLRRAGVIQVHPDDDHLIRLSDYNG